MGYCVGLFCLISFSLTAICYAEGQDCNEVDFRSCLTQINKLSQDEFDNAFNTEQELLDFCRRAITESFCFQQEFCKKEYPRLSNLVSSLFNHVNQICNFAYGRSTVYLTVAPCHEHHSKDFDKCKRDSHKIMAQEKDDIKETCRGIHKILCVADTSRKHCGAEGHAFASFIETGLRTTYDLHCYETKSRATATRSWFYTLAPPILLAIERLMLKL